MKFRWLRALVCAFCICSAFGRRDGLAKDCLWRVKTPASTLYLLGSVHALESSDYPLAASYEAAYSAAQQVAFEINIDDATTSAMQNYILNKAALPNGKSIKSLLSSATY